MKKIILIGGGGHALSLLEMIKDYSLVAGYSDLFPNNAMFITYLGNDSDIISNYSPFEYKVHYSLVYTSKVDLSLRKKMQGLFSLYESATFISDTALVTKHSEISSGAAIFERVIINRSKIGRDTILNTGSIIEHDCNIGNNVFIGPGVIVGGEVSIQDNTFVGMGAVIRDNVAICSDVIIGMGSLVTRNVTEPGIYIGRPARLVYEEK